jgi:mannose-6-phosphate isomerase-like protein (cupin superfamily)
MEAHHALAAIRRHYQEGEQLDVAGLNRINVLVDRSQTGLTEVGWNYWKPNLDGPPHFHEAKEQIFFATEGEAVVTIANREFRLVPNAILHVPMGAMHRTVVVGGAPHAYLLFNAFRDSDKEGKASFSDHLSEAKHIRRQQADAANQGGAIDWARLPAAGTLAQVDASLPPAGATELSILIPRANTLRASAAQLRLGAGQSLALDEPETELTLFALAGSGQIEVGGQSLPVAAGVVVYAPPGACAASAGPDGLACLCLRTYLTQPPAELA